MCIYIYIYLTVLYVPYSFDSGKSSASPLSPLFSYFLSSPLPNKSGGVGGSGRPTLKNLAWSVLRWRGGSPRALRGARGTSFCTPGRPRARATCTRFSQGARIFQ